MSRLASRLLLSSLSAWIALGIAFGCYLAIFLPLIPANGASLGHDYGQFLPMLLTGYFWFIKNGLFSIPWFTPSQCGGVPFLADPSVYYYSLQQWANFFVSPVTAVRFTFATIAALGTIGSFLLLRDRFHVSPWAALTAAVLFLFNGYYAYRTAIGHLSFNPFALAPWLTWALLIPRPQPNERSDWLASVAAPTVIGALVIAYMFHGGMVHTIPPTLIATTVILLLHGQIHDHSWRPWLLFAGAMFLALALSAQRLTAALAFLQYFPRSLYPLPGFPSVFDLLSTLAQSLFWTPPTSDVNKAITGITWWLGRHEWEFGMGPVALVLLVAGAGVTIWRAWRSKEFLLPRSGSILVAGMIALLLILPILLNWYEPNWNAFLKSLPYFGSSSSLVRWFCLYIPVITVLCGVAFDRIVSTGRMSAGLALLAAAATVGWNASVDKSFYVRQPYDAGVIERAWHAVKSPSDVPPISNIAVIFEQPNRILLTIDRNDMFANGSSQLYCYQPIFGYRSENMIVGPMRPGPAMAELPGGVFNVKNPSCYLYPDENACKPGDHFRLDQREDVLRFLRYEPFSFSVPLRQHVANWVNLAALVLTILLGGGAILGRLRCSKAIEE